MPLGSPSGCRTHFWGRLMGGNFARGSSRPSNWGENGKIQVKRSKTQLQVGTAPLGRVTCGRDSVGYEIPLLGCWSVGVPGCWGVGVLGYWGVGMLGYWGTGVLGCQGVRVMGYWGAGVLEYWGVRVLGY